MRAPVPGKWSATRPNVLVVACSDGRLQEATDVFLANELGVVRYDRFYVPGGAGALVASGYDFARAHQMRRECRYLIELHAIGRIVLLMHGPVAGGPPEAACADYRRKLPRASVEQLREQQTIDATQLLRQRPKWAGPASVVVYRCEIDAAGGITFVDLAVPSESRGGGMTSTSGRVAHPT
jgi:hypothetical protein